ncbi:MAG: hypothetical protein JXR52_01770 [Bacteroidales bacterium]|nr:hypothetical protein [Bacteroidales bacterium]
MKIESKIGKSRYSDRDIYKFITDFNNFRNLIPEDQVSEWVSSTEQCSFRIDPVGKTGFKLAEKEPFKLVKISSIDESKYDFTIWVQLLKTEADDTRIKITIQPLINAMLLPFVKAPLKQFADRLIDGIEQFNFSSEAD